MSNLQTLPDELLEIIFQDISIIDLFNISITCIEFSKFFWSTNYDTLVKKVLLKTDPFVQYNNKSNNWLNIALKYLRLNNNISKTIDISNLNLYSKPSIKEWTKNNINISNSLNIIDSLYLSNLNNYAKNRTGPIIDESASLNSLLFNTSNEIVIYNLPSSSSSSSSNKNATNLTKNKKDKESLLKLIPFGTTTRNLSSENIETITNKNNSFLITYDSYYFDYSTPLSLSSLTSIKSPTKNHWKFNPPCNYEDMNILFGINNDLIYLLSESLINNNIFISSYQTNHLNLKNPSILKWKLKLIPNSKVVPSNIFVNEEFILFTLDSSIGLNLKQDKIYSEKNEKQPQLVFVLSTKTGNLIGVYKNQLQCSNYRIINSNVFCDYSNKIYGGYGSNLNETYKLLSLPLIDFLSQLDTTTYNEQFHIIDIDDKNNENSSSKQIQLKNSNLKIDMLNKTNSIKKDWNIVISLNDISTNNKITWSQNQNFISVHRYSNDNSSFKKSSENLYNSWYSKSSNQNDLKNNKEYLFLYNLETNEKKYYNLINDNDDDCDDKKLNQSINISEAGNSKYLLIDDSLNFISLTDGYVQSL